MSMSNTPSPTPSEDNRRNVRNESASQAIDRAMNTAEQSREDLLNSFLFLKKGDVDKASTKGSTKQEDDMMKAIMSSILKKEKGGRLLLGVKDRSLEIQKKKVGLTGTLPTEDCDGIEEEVLEDKNASSRLSNMRIINTGSHLKVDNFVEDETLSDDMTDETDGYSASFHEEQCRTQKPLLSTAPALDTSDFTSSLALDEHSTDRLKTSDFTSSMALDEHFTDRLDTSDFTSSLALDEHSTDKLLLNFLADLQNEQNIHKAISHQGNPEAKSVSSMASDLEDTLENSIDSFIRRNNRKQDNMTVDFSSDDDDATMSLVDNSSETNVKVVVKHNDLDEITKSDSSGDGIPLKQNRMVMDSEGNMCEDINDVENTDDDQTVSNVVFPGEIVADEHVNKESLTCSANERLLDFKAIYKKPSESGGSSSERGSVEASSDDVEPFHLDPDFDYDNVVLTPKYSDADMERLQALFQMKTAVM